MSLTDEGFMIEEIDRLTAENADLRAKLESRHLEHFNCFKCRNGHTTLYCLSCANDELHANLERVEKWRVDLKTKLRLAGEVRSELSAQLLHARERADRAEACAEEMRSLIGSNLRAFANVGKLSDALHALSTKCGVGWLSPEKVKELEQQLSESNHWRDRHSKDAEAHGKQSQSNWEKVNRLREALKDVTECSEVVLANAHWEVSYGSGDLRNALKRAKQAIAPEAAP